MTTRFIVSNHFTGKLLCPIALVSLAAQMGCDNEPTAALAAQPSVEQAQKAVKNDVEAAPKAEGVLASAQHDSRQPKSVENAVLNSEASPVSIRFQAKVGEKDFDCDQSYENFGVGAKTIKPRDFRFYVHNIRLVDDQGEEVALDMEDRSSWQSQGVALLDFEDSRGGCESGGDAATNSVVTGSIPQGNYQGLRFSLGIPSSLNHADPLTLDGPFQSAGMAWNWLVGYKFARIELSTVSSSEQELPTNGLFHLGSKACSEENGVYTCARPNRTEVFLPDFQLENGVVIADLGALFAKSDLSSDQVCHSGGEACAPLFEQVGVDLESGAPTDEQQFFSSAQGPGGPAPLTGGSGLLLLGLGLFSISRKRRF